nr:immunoglobulin light chain junction region [Macaca mulatta]MPN79724.1 immunoglobulin light chain junction region [Macaca mulatta]MPN79785.1 immunoglobulin light chain junction region [Macaca mulatta]MPN79795.1 immunoglobulin light chain junction region [Macaca mulatta]MPN79796.1 immunoglobulin light chain junction region [Macaca mulatta]
CGAWDNSLSGHWMF